MSVNEELRIRIEKLIKEGDQLSGTNGYGRCHDVRQKQLASAWITSAQNAIYLICPSTDSPYRITANKFSRHSSTYTVCQAVGEFTAVLRGLLIDADAGLVSSIIDRATAEAFDNFLDHGEAYLISKRKKEAGVIIGVVFEDTIRRLCKKLGNSNEDAPLDKLISLLAAEGELSGTKAKRARTAAHVRTKATHASWNDFDESDVQEALTITRELIETKLDQ